EVRSRPSRPAAGWAASPGWARAGPPAGSGRGLGVPRSCAKLGWYVIIAASTAAAAVRVSFFMCDSLLGWSSVHVTALLGLDGLNLATERMPPFQRGCAQIAPARASSIQPSNVASVL